MPVRSGYYCHGSQPLAISSESATTLEATLSITSAAVAEPGVIVVSARPARRVQHYKKVKRQTQRQATVVPAIIVIRVMISSQLTLTLIGQLHQSRTEDSDGAPDPLARAGKQMPSRASRRCHPVTGALAAAPRASG
jgi:hypothetical protein